jgi:hypothetical protein
MLDLGPEDRTSREWHLNFWPRQSFCPRALEVNRLTNMTVVGSRRNTPTCLDEELPVLMDQALQPIVGDYEYHNPTELCTHRLYRGSHYANLGGVCRTQSSGPRKMEYQEHLKSPYFTRVPRSYGVLSLHSLAMSDVLEEYCSSACSCSHSLSTGELSIAVTSRLKAVLGAMTRRWKIFGSQRASTAPTEEKDPNSGQ